MNSPACRAYWYRLAEDCGTIRRRAGESGIVSLDKHTEHTNPTSTIFLWQKQAARKSTLSWVGTEMSCLIAGGGKNDIYKNVRRDLMGA